MSQRRQFASVVVAAAVSAAVLAAVAGCQNHPTAAKPNLTAPPSAARPDSVQAVRPPQPPPVDVEPATQPGRVVGAEAVTQQVQNYAHELAPQIEHRPRPTSEPSAVQWADERRGGGPATRPIVANPGPPPQVVPLARPAIDNTPSLANQVAYVPNEGAANPTAPMRVPPGEAARATLPPKPAGLPLEDRLARKVAEYPRDLSAQVDLQLLKFIEDQQVPALDTMAGLPLEDRELLSALMDGLSNFRNGLRSDANMLLSRKVKALIDLADRLRAQAELTIPTLALCTKVDGFGSYDPIESGRFVAGRENMAIVYCEVDNFSAQQNDKKVWETKLAQETVLYTEDGLPVWQDKPKTIIDHARNRRHDFFVVKMIKLPSTLTIGRYLLKVTVQDHQSNRVAEATVPVEIVAQ